MSVRRCRGMRRVLFCFGTAALLLGSAEAEAFCREYAPGQWSCDRGSRTRAEGAGVIPSRVEHENCVNGRWTWTRHQDFCMGRDIVTPDQARISREVAEEAARKAVQD